MTKANTPPEADLSQDPDFDGELPHPANAAVQAREAAPEPEADDPDATGEVLDDAGAGAETPERGPDGKFLPKDKAKEKKAAEETPEAKELREKEEANAKRFATLELAKREQLKVSKARQDLEQREASLQNEIARVNQEIQRADTALKAREAKVAKFEAAIANPSFEAFAELGLDYATWTRQALAANTPEEAARRAARAETERMRQEMKERDEREAKQRQDRELAEANRHDARTLVGLLEKEPGAFPDLVEYPDEEIAEAGIAIRDQMISANGGRPPTYAEVLGELQKRAKVLAENRKRTVARRQTGITSEQGRTAPNGTDHQASNGRTGKPSLTSDTAGQRPSPTREMTEEEKDEWALSQLRGLRRAQG